MLGKPFTVRTDYSSLGWLLRFKESQGQLARWIEELSQYDMVIKYRSGGKHTNCDSLSRIPVGEITCDQFVPGVKPTDLPCGGCSYCVRADSQWGAFSCEVDEAVQLTSLGTSGCVVHDDKVSGVEGFSHRGTQGPSLVGDTLLSCGDSPKERQSSSDLAWQQYQGISAETVRVVANNQNQIDGKTVYGCGRAYEVIDQTHEEQNPTGQYDWGISRSLSGRERPTVRHTSIKTDGEPYIEILSREGTVDVNLFKKKSNRKAMNRNWSNQKANPALKTKREINKYYK